MSNYRYKTLWLTNVPAPYRLGIWNKLADFVELKVVFILKEKNWRNWPAPVTDTWQFQYLSFSSFKFGDFQLVPNFFGATKLLKGQEIVIIGGWESPMFMRMTFLAKKRGLTVVHFYESTLQSHRYNNIYIQMLRRKIFSAADFIVTPGEASSQAVLAMGISREKIVTLFNPVDVSWFNEHAQLFNEISTPGHRFLFVGQLIKRKNLSTLINAFSSVRTEFDTLTIAGEGEDESMLKELTLSLGVSEHVKFIGQQSQDDLAQIYSRSQTLILPSTNEVWGLVVNEALACGLQVIVSEKCGVAKFVEHMDGVFTCEPTAPSVAGAMNQAKWSWTGLIADPEILEYTPEAFAEELLRLVIHRAK